MKLGDPPTPLMIRFKFFSMSGDDIVDSLRTGVLVPDQEGQCGLGAPTLPLETFLEGLSLPVEDIECVSAGLSNPDVLRAGVLVGWTGC